MIGEIVIVRDYREAPTVCRVIEVCHDRIYVLSEGQYIKGINGLDAVDPIGVPVHDVFHYDIDAQTLIQHAPVKWAQLKRFHG